MRSVLFVLAVLLAAPGIDAQTQTQRRPTTGRGGGSATLAIVVTDPAGTPVSNVLVTVEGPAKRTMRTEGGRIAFEGVPAGTYRLRFEREGYVTLERELTARAGAPTDVKVTLTPAPVVAPPPPPPAPEPVDRPKPAVDAKPALFDVPSVFEREFIGRGTVKNTPLACGVDGSATLMQIKEAIPEQAHAESDEFLYVIGGEGRAYVAGRDERLKAGVLLFVPRGVPHALAAVGRNPLVLVSTRAGEGCGTVPRP